MMYKGKQKKQKRGTGNTLGGASNIDKRVELPAVTLIHFKVEHQVRCCHLLRQDDRYRARARFLLIENVLFRMSPNNIFLLIENVPLGCVLIIYIYTHNTHTGTYKHYT